MRTSETKVIKEHIAENKKRLTFLKETNGNPHAIFVLTERINYWTSKLAPKKIVA